MPSRPIVFAIAAFWIAASCALFMRDIVPRWQAGAAPAYNIDLTDEVGSPQVVWEVYQKGVKIGRGVTHIGRLPDRTFEMSQKFHFDDLRTSILGATLQVKRLDTIYRVTRDGQLLGMRINGEASLGDALNASAELDGDVKDGYLLPKLRFLGSPVDLGSLGKLRVAEHGSVLNPMHLLHRLPGLQDGQQWKVPLFDPLKMFSEKFVTAGSPFLEATVSVDTLDWNVPAVECFRIVYREPGKDVVAQTWVRRADGLVLAQHARQHGHEFTIRRVPESQRAP